MKLATPIVLAAMLAACSGGDAGAGNEEAVGMAAPDMSEASRMQPGEYETRVTMREINIPGLPESMVGDMRGMMEQPYRGCLTAEDLERPDESFFSGPQSDCSYEEFSMEGGRLNARMQCTAEGVTQEMAMTGTYEDDGYEMDIEMRSEDPESSMSWTIRSQRVGDCA